MKVKLVEMTKAFSAYNNGELSTADLACEIIVIWNAATAANPKATRPEILEAVVARFIDGVRTGDLYHSKVHTKTQGINFPRIAEAMLHVSFERGEIVTACRVAYEAAGHGKLNSGVFGRVGKDKANKPQPSYKSCLTSIKGNIKKVKAIKDTKANAEAKAALLLEVKALQGLLV